ncbi:MAG: TRAP transporter substrate-binding protein [Anaeromyxobacter sp.]|nr:TRAP transporter substrate-binding protein [Anaeromyxobacter sp.]MBL0274749.1 TRAP transporter substrate-binding protein [Anaeromyxobacter sp.]
MAHPARPLLAALALAALPAPGAAAPPIVIRFSHVVAVDTPKGQAAELFARRAAELTRGRVQVRVFPNGTLYKDQEEIQALQLGAVELLAPSLSKFGPIGVREFEVFDLPFLFEDEAALRKVTGGAVGQMLLRRLQPKGLLGLGFWDSGFKSFSANRPLHRPEDFRGLRIRIQASGVLDAQMRALGALPQVLPFPEVYRALEAGVVDGAENPIANFWTQGMYRVQKHLSLTRHGYLGYAVITNRRFWDALPADLRRALEQALDEATEHANRLAHQRDEEDLERVRRTGTTVVFVPSGAERQAFVRALLPVHQAMEQRLGPDLIRAIYQATGTSPPAP